MYNFKTLKCGNCNSVMLNLPQKEIEKLNGLNFQCENCGHLNVLVNLEFHKAKNLDPLLNIINSKDLATA